MPSSSPRGKGPLHRAWPRDFCYGVRVGDGNNGVMDGGGEGLPNVSGVIVGIGVIVGTGVKSSVTAGVGEAVRGVSAGVGVAGVGVPNAGVGVVAVAGVGVPVAAPGGRGVGPPGVTVGPPPWKAGVPVAIGVPPGPIGVGVGAEGPPGVGEAFGLVTALSPPHATARRMSQIHAMCSSVRFTPEF